MSMVSDLFLEELMSHGNEGDGQSTTEEEDEVNSQLVSETLIFSVWSDFYIFIVLTCC